MKVFPLLLLSSLFFITSCYQYSNLTYQAHGFNDLDFFLQQLVKGTNFFKIDVSEATELSCVSHSTWDYDNDCEYLDYFNICCLGFRGDTGSEPVLSEPFNTTYDLLRVLNSSRFDFIWQRQSQLSQYNFTKYIAINFQFGHSFANISKFFIYNLLKIIEARDLNIQIITGTNHFITDYEDKCRTGNCDFMEQYIANSNVMFQSSSYSETDNRVTNFNVDYGQITDFCANGFPDWPDLYGLPYMFWEPSSEDTIKFVLNSFKNESCKKTALHQNISDIKITSNLEPEMIEIYSKAFNNTEDILKILLQGGSDPHIQFDEETNTIFLTRVMNEATTLFQVFSVNTNISQLQGESLILEMQETLPFRSTKFERKQKFLMFFSDEVSFIYFLYYNGEFILSLIDGFENEQGLLASTLVVNHELPYFCHLFSLPQNNSLQLTIFDIFNNETIVVKSLELPDNEISESILNLDMTSIIDNSEFKIVIVFSKNVQPQNKIGLFSIILEISESFVINETTASTSPFDFGDYPSVKLFQPNNGDLMLLEVHTDGLCQCGMLMNNNEFGKCNFANDKNHYDLLNIKYLMNSIWGTFSDFKARVITGNVINGCDQNLMHAKFNNGRKPKAEIWAYNDRLQALIVNEYVGYDELPLTTRLLCGGNQRNLEHPTNSTENIVIQSFSLTDSLVFAYLNN